MCPYYCSLLLTELIDQFSQKSEEHRATKKIWQIMELNVTWKVGNTDLLSAGQGQKYADGFAFVVKRK